MFFTSINTEVDPMFVDELLGMLMEEEEIINNSTNSLTFVKYYSTNLIQANMSGVIKGLEVDLTS